MTRILVVKASELSMLWLDELCNGLLTQAKFAKFFARKSSEDELVVLCPRYANIDSVVVWSADAKFPWAKVKALFPVADQVHWVGDFAGPELNEGKLAFDRLLMWEGHGQNLDA